MDRGQRKCLELVQKFMIEAHQPNEYFGKQGQLFFEFTTNLIPLLHHFYSVAGSSKLPGDLEVLRQERNDLVHNTPPGDERDKKVSNLINTYRSNLANFCMAQEIIPVLMELHDIPSAKRKLEQSVKNFNTKFKQEYFNKEDVVKKEDNLGYVVIDSFERIANIPELLNKAFYYIVEMMAYSLDVKYKRQDRKSVV